MTDEELARALCRAHVEGVGGWGEGAWLAVARRARELLSAPALPAEPAPGFVRVQTLGFITADVPLPPAPAEIIAAVTEAAALRARLAAAIDALEQAQDCIRDETPECGTWEEARDDTLAKIRAVILPPHAPAKETSDA